MFRSRFDGRPFANPSRHMQDIPHLYTPFCATKQTLPHTRFSVAAPSAAHKMVRLVHEATNTTSLGVSRTLADGVSMLRIRRLWPVHSNASSHPMTPLINPSEGSERHVRSRRRVGLIMLLPAEIILRFGISL